MWSQSPVSLNGRFYRYSVSAEVLPGAEAAPANVGRRAFPRRLATQGPARQQLAPIGGAVAFPLRLQEVWAHLDMLKQPTEAGRRDFSALTISYKAPFYDTGIPSPDGSRRFFSSEPEHIAEGIRTSAAIGVHKLIFDFCGGRLWRALSACSGSPPPLIPLMTG